MKDKKTKDIHFRCSENEFNQIVAMAKPYGSVTKLIRESLFSNKRVFIDPKTFLEGMNTLTTAVNRVGNNVNQIARFLNTTKNINDYVLIEQWFSAFEEYKDILRDVRKEIKKTYSID